MRRRSAKNKASQEKLRQAESQLGIREEKPIKTRQTFRERLKSIVWFVGVLTTLLALYYPISDALREPEIQHSLAQVDDPFFVRFSLHNPSVIFSMTDMKLNCVFMKVELENNLSLVGIPIDDLIETSIQPGKTVEYECPIHKVLDDIGPILHATIRIDVTFKTLWHERTTESELFNWDIVSRQWIKGEIIN